MEDRPEGRQAQGDCYSAYSETLISEPQLDQSSTSSLTASDLPEDGRAEPVPAFNQTEIFRALEVVERDSVAIADSFTSLFDSLRLALSEVRSLPFNFFFRFRLLTSVWLLRKCGTFMKPSWFPDNWRSYLYYDFHLISEKIEEKKD